MTAQSTQPQARGAMFGLAAAALFGASTPLAKMLLSTIDPTLLAGLLYLGAAVGLWLHRAVTPTTNEAPLTRDDVPRLAGVVLAGGVIAPVLMLFGLQRVTALSGSLLLNLEAPFTVLLAVLLFREHLGCYAAGAIAFILSGAAVLKAAPGTLGADAVGVMLLAAACLCWALDNNLTQRLSLRDPFAIVRIKTLVAGVANTVLGLLVTNEDLPATAYILGALALGSMSYGVSVVLDAYALRLVGAAREAAYFATAPFVGALISVVVLGDSLRWFDLIALACMGVGVGLLLRERHGHLHAHDAIEHVHLHEHDEHHQHLHAADDPPGVSHSHRHRHEPIVHQHAHVPDIHHRHRH